MKRQVFIIHHMSCSGCALRLQGLEDSLPGVRQVDASYHRARMEVVYDEGQVTEEEIIEAVRSLGYEAERS
ncbi:MAG: cation transporter [Anaerolinea sp.]|nr:cation transporter [Anaerolinea sp.]